MPRPVFESHERCPKCGLQRNQPGLPGTNFKVEYKRIKGAVGFHDECLELTCPRCSFVFEESIYQPTNEISEDDRIDALESLNPKPKPFKDQIRTK